MSNLPRPEINSDTEVRDFFDGYFIQPISFPSNELDATIGYFKGRGFDDVSANAVSVVILRQAKVDNIKIFELLDSLKNISDVKLLGAVVEILNYDREAVSVLGYRFPKEFDSYESRNIRL